MVRFCQVGSVTAAQRVPEKSVIAPRPGGHPQQAADHELPEAQV
ncbi:MAG: hypothetical protein WAK57_19740 [Desulfobacterales bacterium]